MTKWIKKNVATTRLLELLLLLALGALVADNVHAGSVAQVMEKKTLPDATIAVIDPETGTSSGSGGIYGVKIDVGDIILFKFAMTPAPYQEFRGIQSYLTEYIPENTEVVGVRITDADGNTITPRYPGLANYGCKTGCPDFTGLPCTVGSDGCSGGTIDLQRGSIAQVHADTGIFYAADTETRLARNPGDQFITMDNGTVMNPQPVYVAALIDLLDAGTTIYAHNAWDWTQVRAYGISTAASGNSGKGETPFGYGSEVAGPETYYPYEATDVGGNVRFNNVVGPWHRIRYPGSKIGTGPADAGELGPDGLSYTRAITDPVGSQIGWDATPMNAISAGALRFALGDTRVGSAQFVEVALRVLALPLDPNFGGGPGEHVNCGEVVGTNIATRRTGSVLRGEENPWSAYLGSPSCVYLRLLLDLTGSTDLAVLQNVNYTLRTKNLSVNDETNVRVELRWDDTEINYSSTDSGPPPDGATYTCTDDSSSTCLNWTIGTLAPSDELNLGLTFAAKGSGGRTGNVTVRYYSDQLPAPGYYTTRDIYVQQQVPSPTATLAPVADPTVTAASAGGTYALSGTLKNVGNYDGNFKEVNPVLPSGWSLASNRIVINGVNVTCTSTIPDHPVCGFTDNFTPGETRTLAMTVNVPSGEATDLYDLDVQLWMEEVETYFDHIATVPVGAVRTQKPVLDCPIGSTDPAITGTSEDNADVTLYFNLMERGFANEADNGSGDGGAWEISDYDYFAPPNFGDLYGGLEVSAIAQVTGKLPSERSDRCDVEPKRQCSDGLDNDGDGEIDFPADTGCDSPSDNDESNDPQCSDGIDNNSAGGTDWPADPSCYGPDDPTEDGIPACSDGVDNDGDGAIDYPDDPDCTSASDPDEATLRQCQNRVDDDSNSYTDFDTDPDHFDLSDPGCHSRFDDEEYPVGFTPADVYGRILIVFDTSGSMNLNTCTDLFTGGDGSEDFPGEDTDCGDLPATCLGTPAATSLCGNGLADDSRMYQVKQGLTNVINSFGEVEYALMRFHQRGVEFQPPTAAGSLPSGGWQGAGAPCGDFASGDVVVSFSPDNPQTLLAYLDGKHNYPGTVPPATLDWELRGTGTTPLAGALGDALTYLQAVKAADPVESIEADCRPYRVVLVTDGLETCGGDPVVAADALWQAGFEVSVIAFSTSEASVTSALNDIAAAGGGYYGDLTNPAAPNAIPASDQAALSSAFAQIITETIKYEICDGQDNDCDGEIDEDFPDLGETCDNGYLGICHEDGTVVCDYPPDFPAGDGSRTRCLLPGAAPLPGDYEEVCSTVDEDCDGLNNEGLTCTCGGEEVCNGLDDNCNGEIDEPNCVDDGAGDICDDATHDLDQTACEAEAGCRWYTLPGVGEDCGTDIGLCEFGSLACVDPDADPDTPNSSLECEGGTGPAAADPCDGWDNDCDAQVDEDFGEICYPDGTDGCTWNVDHYDCLGICQPGNLECYDPTPGQPENGDSEPGSCIGYTGPATEVCNGIDDDCNGTVDDAWPDEGQVCSNGLEGECEAFGFLVCDPADPSGPLICTAPTITPGVEVCNNLDDDCDGLIDEGDCLDDGAGDATCNPLDQATCETTTGCVWQNMPPVGNICGGGGGCDNGYFQCIDGAIECVGSSSGSPEVCDGVDNDCDDQVDEPDNSPVDPGIFEIEKACFPTGIGNCMDDGAGPETCGGLDEGNCGSTTGCVWKPACTGDPVAGFPGFVFNPVCEGECAPGETVCVPPDILCLGFQGPAASETCNGVDDNCDGLVDNEAVCPTPGDICYEGVCVFPCDNTEFPCPFGYYCEELDDSFCEEFADPPCRYCLEDQCIGVTCDPGFRCDPETGECQDLCDGVDCPEGKTCRGGFCFDCFDSACPGFDYCCAENENCVAGTGGVGVCEEDLCYDVTCDSDQFCRDGDCIDLVCSPPCGSGTVCVDGECVDDPCSDVTCSGGKVCNPLTGECVGDLCSDVGCNPGQACNPATGECIADPCIDTDCPAGYHCEVSFSGSATCLENQVNDDGEWVYAGGGGGCAVGDAPGSGRPAWLLLLGLGLLWWRRRR